MQPPLYGIRKSNQTRIAIGLGVLLLGTLVYLVDRPSEQGFLFNLSLSQFTPTLFGVLGDSLPTFAHVFAFSLLTVALLRPSIKVGTVVCLGWFFLDAAFEVSQHPSVAQWVTTLIPSWFEHIPILEQTEGYFVYGTFDPADMLSIAVGAMVAYLVIQKTQYTAVSDE